MNCESEQQGMVTIPAGAREQFTFTCSQQDPYLQSWDAAQHRYIELGAAGFTPGSVTLIAKNVGLKPGSFIVTLGCMPQASASTDYMGSKGYKYKESQPPVSDVCSGVPNCQPQTQSPLTLKGEQRVGWA